MMGCPSRGRDWNCDNELFNLLRCKVNDLPPWTARRLDLGGVNAKCKVFLILAEEQEAAQRQKQGSLPTGAERSCQPIRPQAQEVGLGKLADRHPADCKPDLLQAFSILFNRLSGE